MTGNTHAFVPLKGSSPLSCTGTMPRDLSCGRAGGIDVARAAAAAQGNGHGTPAPCNPCTADLTPFMHHRAAGGELL